MPVEAASMFTASTPVFPYCKVLSSRSDWAYHGPLQTIDHDLGTDQPVGQRRDDLLALFVGRESILAEAVTERATEQCLTTPMPGRSMLI